MGYFVQPFVLECAYNYIQRLGFLWLIVGILIDKGLI